MKVGSKSVPEIEWVISSSFDTQFVDAFRTSGPVVHAEAHALILSYFLEI